MTILGHRSQTLDPSMYQRFQQLSGVLNHRLSALTVRRRDQPDVLVAGEATVRGADPGCLRSMLDSVSSCVGDGSTLVSRADREVVGYAFYVNDTADTPLAGRPT